MPEGETIVKIVVRFDMKVNALEFITNLDSNSPMFGGYKGEERTFTVPNGYSIDGIYGRKSYYLSQIGFYLVTIDVNE